MRVLIAAIASLCLSPALANATTEDPMPVVNREHKSDREPVMICITLAPSPTSLPECIDLSQWAGHQR